MSRAVGLSPPKPAGRNLLATDYRLPATFFAGLHVEGPQEFVDDLEAFAK
jgi:hypothetical protein